MSATSKSGPAEHNWLVKLGLVQSVDDGWSILCNHCVKYGLSPGAATKKIGASAAKAYTHLRVSHKEIADILEPIITDRENHPKKRAHPVASRKVDEMFKAASQRPTATKNVVENDTFRDLFRAAGASVDILSIKTLSKCIKDEFLRVLCDIGSLVGSAEFYMLTFDAWTTHKNASLFGFTIAFLCKKLRMVTKSVANLLLPGSPDAVAVWNAIHKIVTERLSMRRPAFFVTDTTNFNPREEGLQYKVAPKTLGLDGVLCAWLD